MHYDDEVTEYDETEVNIINRHNDEVIYTTLVEDEFSSMNLCSPYGIMLGRAVEEAIQEGVSLKDANLEYMRSCVVDKLDLEGADLEGSTFMDATLEGSNLKGANLKNAYFEEVDMGGVNLEGANLEGADLTEAYLEKANLKNVNLTGVDLTDAYLVGADLTGANIKDADITGAVLVDVNLTGVNLRDANLETIKQDMFDLLKEYSPEVPMVKEAIVKGKLNGSAHSNNRSCIMGTIEKSGRFGTDSDIRFIDRPITTFVLSVRKKDNPENNQFSKLALEWIEEFESELDKETPDEK